MSMYPMLSILKIHKLLCEWEKSQNNLDWVSFKYAKSIATVSCSRCNTLQMWMKSTMALHNILLTLDLSV